MQTSPTRPTTLSIPDLRAEIHGQVIGPDDKGYDEARVVFAGGIDRRPAVIVKVADTDDVARVIGLARETGLDLSVRSGGHSGAGHSVNDGGIVLDLRDMDAVHIDPATRTGWAQSGATAADFTSAASEHGLVVGFGDTGSVGLGGITTGGGVGFLVRKFGLTIDDLLEAEIVTADGEVLTVDAEHHPDLFWAIRGGGGNFGVATKFTYRLHEMPSVVGGMLFLPATAEVVEGFIAAAQAAPEELSTIANVMSAPPMPFLPEDQVGKLILMAFMTYAGDTEAGQAAIAPFRALATPIADMIRPMKYAEMYPPEEAGADYHPTASAKNLFIDRVDRPTAELIMERLESIEAPLRAAQLRVLGGAMARVPSDATAFAHRDSKIMVNIAAFYEGAEDKVAKDAWVDSFMAALKQDDDGVYVNFLVDEGPERIRAAYPGGTYERLAEIKRRYDPTNLFHLNQNIPPAA